MHSKRTCKKKKKSYLRIFVNFAKGLPLCIIFANFLAVKNDWNRIKPNNFLRTELQRKYTESFMDTQNSRYTVGFFPQRILTVRENK